MEDKKIIAPIAQFPPKADQPLPKADQPLADTAGDRCVSYGREYNLRP